MPKKLLPAALIGLLLSGCGYYRPDIQQGNVVSAEMANRLELGMTQRQVRFLLGTPLVQDPFHANRWDYVYSFHYKGRTLVAESQMTLYFENERLARIKRGTSAGVTPDSGAQTENLTAEDTIVISTDKELKAPDTVKKQKKGLFGKIWDKVTP
ncbi:MAG: outer membrane protein assembly factor BamE [Gammaproteobacteria bacterium]|jgi:outer membrane protein assembly factor BamE|nr:outer membrane protein assembly factor BamE [Gammaproteobacteria bacterium]